MHEVFSWLAFRRTPNTRNTTHHLRFRESFGAILAGAGLDAVADLAIDAAGLGIRPNRNSCGGAAVGSGAPANGAGPGAVAIVAAAMTAADVPVATGIVLPAPLPKLSAAATRHTHTGGGVRK